VDKTLAGQVESIRSVRGKPVKVTYTNADPMFYYRKHEILQYPEVQPGEKGRWEHRGRPYYNLLDIVKDIDRREKKGGGSGVLVRPQSFSPEQQKDVEAIVAAYLRGEFPAEKTGSTG
jgi:hypothetical protein